jgi:hypothetical protein
MSVAYRKHKNKYYKTENEAKMMCSGRGVFNSVFCLISGVSTQGSHFPLVLSFQSDT